jgi:hypothetical protein
VDSLKPAPEVIRVGIQSCETEGAFKHNLNVDRINLETVLAFSFKKKPGRHSFRLKLE